MHIGHDWLKFLPLIRVAFNVINTEKIFVLNKIKNSTNFTKLYNIPKESGIPVGFFFFNHVFESSDNLKRLESKSIGETQNEGSPLNVA